MSEHRTSTPSDATTPSGTPLSVAHGDAPSAAASAVLAHYEEWVRRTPDAPAVLDGEDRWSYAEIDAAAADVAAALRDRVRPGDLVGVCLDRSAALVVTAVALARLGAVYLPLGPRPGERRIAAVTENVRVGCLIGEPALLPEAHRTGEQLALALPGRGANAPAAAVAAFTTPPEGASAAPEGTFYAVLTSGSTGTPKAVAVAEPALGALLDWYRAETGAGPGERQSLLIGVAFDPHLMELWGGLTSGAALCPAPDAVRWDPAVLTDWWRDARITVSVAATPMAEPVLDRPWPTGLTLRHLVVGGDRMRRRPAAGLPVTVHNAYGPAESTVVTTTYAMRPGEAGGAEGAPPIGRPVPGVTVCVTDEQGALLPRGEAGELRIGGRLLALGYLDEALTAQRFTAAPDGLGVPEADRVYRTGDRVRMREDGELEFLGRLDDQVKISGVRIEPAEVASALERDPGVAAAVVAVRRTPAGDARLAAFVQAAPGHGLSPSAVLSGVRPWLPEQAVPASLTIVDGFPLDANGKVDRAALLATGESAPATAADGTGAADGSGADEGTGAGERLVLRLCRDLLGAPEIRLTDNFTEAGGNSLALARLLTAVREESGVRLRAPEVLRQPDLRAVAALLDSRRPVGDGTPATASGVTATAATGTTGAGTVSAAAPPHGRTPDGDGVLPVLIARHAARRPDDLAVLDGGITLTYRQLVSSAAELAGRLRERGVRPGDRVALLVPRSARTVVAQLGVWWAGATCVPLDPAHPAARTARMLADTEAVLTLTDGKLLESSDLSPEKVLVLPADGALPDVEPAAVAEPVAAGPDSAALVLFTSGSTGRPKGVAVTHRGIADLVRAPGYATVTPRDRVLFHSPVTFDASTFELWGALANGASVAVCTAERPSLEDLAQQVERHGVTVAFFTTALFHQLAVRRSRLFGVVRTVMVGGEALAAAHARAVLRAFPWLELVNAYGPTEATTFATVHRVTDADCDGQVPIGRAVAGATTHVLDGEGNPVAPGTQGELWVGGTRLALGYVGLPELTAERFVDHPAHGRLYRTGDLVSARPDGVLDFHGRADDQVKVRGFRIEPGEIEHALREEPEVDDAAVTVRRPSADDARLAAFVVAAPGPLPRAETLRARLAGRLPAHLVPDEWTVVDRLPLTSSGKVDRRALAELDGSGTGALDTAAPALGDAALGPIEQAVARAWSLSLGREVTERDADFIELGGHSLLALAVVDDLYEELGVELPLADFFATPTVAGHAAVLERALLAELGDEAGLGDEADGPEASAAPAAGFGPTGHDGARTDLPTEDLHGH
ncbi:amino acid adenylation domain-containing protein [Streptomyces sp. bgisy100]|uniref:amino acid adenylation domain-containing protein n=1 Tax=Streptomyces sp. bgisy100 TaxID=3413783 RepID=UPI003D705CF1